MGERLTARERIDARRKATVARMHDPATADNMKVRLDLMARVKSGEITLEECQAELRRIQRKAKKEGKPTAYGTQSWVKPHA